MSAVKLLLRECFGFRISHKLHSQLVFSRLKATSTHDLKRVFDDQRYFKNFNDNPEISGKSTGLFKNQMLTNPKNLVEFSKKSLKSAKYLVKDIIDQVKIDKISGTSTGRLNYIKKLDQLSDILCRVIDVAEFIRVVHPNETWITSAQETHEIMFEYMNILNVNVELWENLRDILQDPQICHQLSNEEIQVGEYLKQDFERSGIHMDPQTRDNFVNITQQISLLGSKFNNGIHDLPEYWCKVSTEEFDSIEDLGLKQEIKSYQLSHDDNGIQIPIVGHIPYSILSDCSCESLRKKVWIALHNSTNSQIENLNEFLKLRAYLAKMLGYKSFAHYQLEHKMAKNPENVNTFLKNLQKNLSETGVKNEIEKLVKFKPNVTYNNLDELYDSVKPWDRDYLLNLYQKSTKSPNLQNINEYFSVGTIMAGLSKLFESIYNIKLIPESTMKGETWDNSQVRKLKVFDESKNKILGYLYVDFWSNKVLPSHFTIVCSRKLNNDIGMETTETMESQVQLDETGNYQLPIISLVCNFRKDGGVNNHFSIFDSPPTLLTLDQVDTIFHEMGHAMHSMIGKTDLHNLSGTRCSTDFVELPSVLMEYFLKDYRVLCQIASHYKTGEKLPQQLFESYQQQRIMLSECETYMQSKMALLDQQLHNDKVIIDLANFDSTGKYHQLERQLRIFSDTYSTWHGKFQHLFSYGAVYYSYLLDRAIAEKIWHQLFNENPWCCKAGEKYKQSILKWGGTRDPWLCLADALDNPNIKNVDSKVMEIIGQKNVISQTNNQPIKQIKPKQTKLK